jgi:hypothetical protein
MSDAINAAATYDLEAAGPLASGTQWVTDSQGTQSALALGEAFVGVNTTQPDYANVVVGVQADIAIGPMLSLCNSGGSTSGATGEASIRFANTKTAQRWHVGMGGNNGEGNFFVDGPNVGPVMLATPAGQVGFPHGITVGSVSPASTAPSGATIVQLGIDASTGMLYLLGS